MSAFHGHKGFIVSAAISSNGKNAATAGVEKFVEIWDIETGHPIQTLRGKFFGQSTLEFAPNGKRILLVNNQTTAFVWDVETGHLLKSLSSSNSHKAAYRFTNEGESLLMGNAVGTLRLFSVDTVDEYMVTEGNSANFGEPSFTSDNRFFTHNAGDTPHLINGWLPDHAYTVHGKYEGRILDIIRPDSNTTNSLSGEPPLSVKILEHRKKRSCRSRFGTGT